MSRETISSCDVKPKPRKLAFSCFEPQTAQISAGENETKFLFHKGLLCHLAPFFRAALEGGFVEAKEATIKMSEQEAAVVKRFQYWAYTGEILEETESLQNVPSLVLIQLWLFGQEYGLPDLQNAAMDHLVIRHNVKKTTPTDNARLIYDNTSVGSPLRRFLITRSVQNGNLSDWFSPGRLEKVRADYPKDLLFDMLTEQYNLSNGKGEKIDFFDLHCTFHVHPTVNVESKQEVALREQQSLQDLEQEDA